MFILISNHEILYRIVRALDKGEHIKAERLQREAESRLETMSRIYSCLAANTIKIFDAATQKNNQIFKQAVTEVDGGDKTKVSEKYISYHLNVSEIIFQTNNFMRYINLCVLSMSSLKEYKMNENLNNVCNISLDLIKSYGKLRK